MVDLKILAVLFFAYCAILYFSIDHKNFSFKKPFFINFFMSAALSLAQLISIFAFVLCPKADYGVPGILFLVFIAMHPILLFFAMLFKSHSAGLIFIIAAFLLSIFSANHIYSLVDNKTFAFGKDPREFNKVICSERLLNIMDALENARKNLPATSEIALKTFPDHVFDQSSEVYIYLNQTQKFKMQFGQKMLTSKTTNNYRLTNICKLEETPHNFYVRGGKFSDIVVYCDDVNSAEIQTAIDKARKELASKDNKDKSK
ncbi:MAG: hypothetical protein QMC67_16055 [Candidatus Wallbacteria bacterium]